MSDCLVCGEGLGRDHETEVRYRRWESSFCPAHRHPEAHDCHSDPSGRFGFDDGAPAPTPAERIAPTGPRTETAESGRGRGARTAPRLRSALGALLLDLYLVNVPLSYAGIVDYPPLGFFLGMGGLLLADTGFGGVSKGGTGPGRTSGPSSRSRALRSCRFRACLRPDGFRRSSISSRPGRRSSPTGRLP